MWGTSSNGETFADVVSGRRGDSNFSSANVITLKHVPSMVGWNNSTLIGELINLQFLTELPKLLEADGNWTRNSGDLFYAGRMRVAMRFFILVGAENFLKTTSNWNRWFKWLKWGVSVDSNMNKNHRCSHISQSWRKLYYHHKHLSENITTRWRELEKP